MKTLFRKGYKQQRGRFEQSTYVTEIPLFNTFYVLRVSFSSTSIHNRTFSFGMTLVFSVNRGGLGGEGLRFPILLTII